jgi:hypothetical protein
MVLMNGLEMKVVAVPTKQPFLVVIERLRTRDSKTNQHHLNLQIGTSTCTPTKLYDDSDSEALFLIQKPTNLSISYA